ncbi:hypothetical protein [Stygiolobus caldivivus]|uniref:Uncharacterized protein n=1 Tax=Stygiolobus caldivivus TaxID=2824673 RepID=A0A8D5U4R8_9CREN|nr:hypothetical protein [Stygiolobus caldivivus]BCU69083.1 hypothetical protein KN1_03800 [Stygiolobus caldivivus]
MLKKDSCGCIVERKYASDYLIKRLYSSGKGKEICNKKIDTSRWFRLYYSPAEKVVTYKSSECPLVIICLEALCEAYEENRGLISRDIALQKLRVIKGLQINTLVERVVDEFTGCLSNG